MYNETMSTTNLIAKNRGCVTNAVAILGDKWTPLIIRCLAEGSNRFCKLQTEAGGINPRTLSARLQNLEKSGIIKKISEASKDGAIFPSYVLTQKGNDLLPIINAMAEWGDKHAPNN